MLTSQSYETRMNYRIMNIGFCSRWLYVQHRKEKRDSYDSVEDAQQDDKNILKDVDTTAIAGYGTIKTVGDKTE